MYDEFDDTYDDDCDRDTIDCPNCGKAMFEDSPRCPGCGHYLTDADRRSQSSPWIRRVIVVMIVWLLLPFLIVLWKMLTHK